MDGFHDAPPHGPPPGPPPNALAMIIRTALNLIQTYGWTVVFGVLGLYIVQPHVNEFFARKQQQASLRSANDPARRHVLDDDMRRVRIEQYRKLQEDAKERKRVLAERKAKQKEEERKAREEARASLRAGPKPKPKPEPTPSTTNPWADSGSGGGIGSGGGVAPPPRVVSRHTESSFNPMDSGGGSRYRASQRKGAPRRGG